MISKRTAIILIIAIVAIIIFEMNFSFDKMKEMEDNIDRTSAEVTINLDGKIIDLSGIEITYSYLNEGKETKLNSKLSDLKDTGFESLKNNAVKFKPCGGGNNSLTFTIPKDLIPTYSSDITVTFGCEKNTADFNDYSLVINLTTIDEASIQANIAETLYYPDDNGKTLNKKVKASTTVNTENSNVECYIAE